MVSHRGISGSEPELIFQFIDLNRQDLARIHAELCTVVI